MKIACKDECEDFLKEGLDIRSFRLIPLPSLLAAVAYLSARLFESRLNQAGFAISHAGGVPVAVGGIYFFTFLSIAASLTISRIRKFSIFATLTLGLLSALAFYEFTYALIYAIFARDIGLLLPEASLPATGWAGYGTWFMLEFFVVSLSYPLWKDLRLTKDSMLLIALYSVAMVAWILIFNFQYPPFNNSAGVYLVNTIAEVAGTLILPLMYTSPEKNDMEHFHTMTI